MSRIFVLVTAGAGDGERLAQLLAGLGAAAHPRREYQIVIVDDAVGSADRVDRAALPPPPDGAPPIETISHRYPRGLRESLRDGIEWIADRCRDDDIAIITRPAYADEVAALPVIVAAVEAGADIAVASRQHGARSATSRAAETLVLRALGWLFQLSNVRDCTSGFFAIRGGLLRAALERYGGQFLTAAPTDTTASLELLCKLVRSGGVCSDVALPPRAAAPPRLDTVDTLWESYRLWSRLRVPEPLPPPIPAGPLQRWEWLALAAILVVALAVRLYALNRIPQVVIHDECDNLVNVYQILNGKGPGLFGFDWKPQPAASIYVLSLSMRLGMSVFTLRLPAVIYSLLALIPFYILARRALTAPPTLLATGLLATDIWYLHFSRTGWENISTCLFLTAAALCVRDAVRMGQMRSFAFAGMWSALGGYSYFSGRAVFPAVVLVILLSLLRPLIPRRRLLVGLLVTVVTCVVLYAPQLPAIVSHWDVFQKRSRTVSILGGYNADKSTMEKAALLVRSFTRKVRQLFIGREMIDRYLRMLEGPLAWQTAMLLAIGLILSLFALRETWLWWVFLLVPFTLTQVLTTGDLNGARGVIMVPMLYLFVALTLHAMWQACQSLHRMAPAVLVVAAVALASNTTRDYFAWIQSPTVVDELQPAISIAEFPAWQDHVMQWTTTSDDFFNVYMWRDYQAKMQPPSKPAADGGGSPPGPTPPTTQ